MRVLSLTSYKTPLNSIKSTFTRVINLSQSQQTEAIESIKKRAVNYSAQPFRKTSTNPVMRRQGQILIDNSYYTILAKSSPAHVPASQPMSLPYNEP